MRVFLLSSRLMVWEIKMLWKLLITLEATGWIVQLINQTCHVFL